MGLFALDGKDLPGIHLDLIEKVSGPGDLVSLIYAKGDLMMLERGEQRKSHEAGLHMKTDAV